MLDPYSRAADIHDHLKKVDDLNTQKDTLIAIFNDIKDKLKQKHVQNAMWYSQWLLNCIKDSINGGDSAAWLTVNNDYTPDDDNKIIITVTEGDGFNKFKDMLEELDIKFTPHEQFNLPGLALSHVCSINAPYARSRMVFSLRLRLNDE